MTTWIRSFSEATSFAARTVIGSYVNEALGSRTHDVAEAYRLAMAEVPVQLRLGAFMRVFIVDRPRSLLRTKCPGSVAQRQSRCLLNTRAWVRVPPVPLDTCSVREPDIRTKCPIAVRFFFSTFNSHPSTFYLCGHTAETGLVGNGRPPWLRTRDAVGSSPTRATNGCCSSFVSD